MTDNTNNETHEYDQKLEEFEQLEREERRAKIKEEMKARLRDESIWIRLFHIVVFGFAFFIASGILMGSIILQFILRVVTGEPNTELQKFGAGLGNYYKDIINYSIFATETAPFPFSAWTKDDGNDNADSVES